MSDTTLPPTAPKSLTTKRIKRRVGKTKTGDETGTPKKSAIKTRGKLAISILRQIAAGKISDPVAAASAFVSGLGTGKAAAAQTSETNTSDAE